MRFSTYLSECLECLESCANCAAHFPFLQEMANISRKLLGHCSITRFAADPIKLRIFFKFVLIQILRAFGCRNKLVWFYLMCSFLSFFLDGESKGMGWARG